LSTKKVILSLFLPFRPEGRNTGFHPSTISRFSVLRVARGRRLSKPARSKVVEAGKQCGSRKGLDTGIPAPPTDLFRVPPEGGEASLEILWKAFASSP